MESEAYPYPEDAKATQVAEIKGRIAQLEQQAEERRLRREADEIADRLPALRGL